MTAKTVVFPAKKGSPAAASSKILFLLYFNMLGFLSQIVFIAEQTMKFRFVDCSSQKLFSTEINYSSNQSVNVLTSLVFYPKVCR